MDVEEGIQLCTAKHMQRWPQLLVSAFEVLMHFMHSAIFPRGYDKPKRQANVWTPFLIMYYMKFQGESYSTFLCLQASFSQT